jgi:hypothetical protein
MAKKLVLESVTQTTTFGDRVVEEPTPMLATFRGRSGVEQRTLYDGTIVAEAVEPEVEFPSLVHFLSDAKLVTQLEGQWFVLEDGVLAYVLFAKPKADLRVVSDLV